MVFNVASGALGNLIRQHERDRVKRLKAAQLEIAMQGAAVIAKNAPKAFGELRRSIGARQTASGAAIEIDAPHAGYVEYGTRPHYPPIGPLLKWAALKAPGNPWPLARYVQKKIGEEGTEPTGFVRHSIPVIMAMADRIYAAALRDR